MSRWKPLLITFVLYALPACGADPHAATLDGEEDAGASTTSGLPPDPCGLAHEEGCPCTTPGASTDCQAVRHSGTYTSCGPGVRFCGDAGTWGACEGPIR
jgi:hypothetical protein